MTEVEKYLFDLRGYLVVEGVLSPDEVADFNRAIDEQHLPEPGLANESTTFGGFLS